MSALTGGVLRPTHGEVGIISAVLMTVVGGYVDAFLYLRHQVFGFAQTGNVVFLAVGLVKGDEWAKFAWPLLAYLAGLGAAQVLRTLVPTLPARALGSVLVFQLVIFTVLACLPSTATAALFVIPLSFVGGVRLELFRTAGGISFVSIATTGNLMRFVAAAADLTRGRSSAQVRAALATAIVVLAFLVGALCGAGVAQTIGPALWGAVLLEALGLAVFVAQVRTRPAA